MTLLNFLFTTCKERDFLATDIGRTSLRFPNAEQGKIYKDSAVVAKVIKDKKAISAFHRNVYNSEEFGDGWVEEQRCKINLKVLVKN